MRSAETVALALARELEDRGIPYAIGGALALGQWGVPRGTVDVDLNLWMDPAKPATVAGLLADLGCRFQSTAVVDSFLKRGWAYALWNGVHVDFYLPTGELHASVRARRQRLSLQGQDVWFLSAEDLAIFKLILFRRKDLADLEALLVVRGRRFDRDYVRSWIARIAGSLDARIGQWDELVADADAVLDAGLSEG